MAATLTEVSTKTTYEVTLDPPVVLDPGSAWGNGNDFETHKITLSHDHVAAEFCDPEDGAYDNVTVKVHGYPLTKAGKRDQRRGYSSDYVYGEAQNAAVMALYTEAKAAHEAAS